MERKIVMTFNEFGLEKVGRWMEYDGIRLQK